MGVVSSNCDLSIPFFFFSFFILLGDGLIIYQTEQQTCQPFTGINSKFTKFGRILEYFFNLNFVLPGNDAMEICVFLSYSECKFY